MNDTARVVQILKEGGIVIFPTETVFGVGCLLREDSVTKLYKIKQRPADQPTLAVFPNLSLIKDFVEFNEAAGRFAAQFWPGPLTLILKTTKNLPKSVLGPGNTLAVRIPSDAWLLKVLKELNEPLLAPSANFKGREAPQAYSEIDKEMAKLVDYVVSKEPGKQKPSTIVDLSSFPYKIVREGAVRKKALQSLLK